MGAKRQVILALVFLTIGSSALAHKPVMERYNIAFYNPSTSCSLFVQEIENSCVQPNDPSFLGGMQQTLDPLGSGGQEGSSVTIGFLPFLDTNTDKYDCTSANAKFQFSYPGSNWKTMNCTVKHYFNDDGTTGRLVECDGDMMNVDEGGDQFSTISFSPDIQNMQSCTSPSPVPPNV